jgi:hypothetical protein
MLQRSYALLLLLLPTACSSISIERYDWDGFLLEERPNGEATSVAWRLFPGEDGARVHRTETRTTQVARLGVVTENVSAEVGERLGVSAWQGVWVRRVDRGSPAASAGLATDDVILALAGAEVSSSEQFRELVETRAVPGEPVELLVQRAGQSGEPRPVSVTPEPRDVTESKTDSIRLESAAGVQELTGMQVATIPAELAEEIFARREDVVVVSGVVSGSPAYKAGIRGGDRIVECDGRPVAALDDVRRAVLARAQNLRVEGRLLKDEDLAGAMQREMGSEPEPERKGDLELVVNGALGNLRARVPVVEDLDRRTTFHIPIVIEYSGSAQRTRTSFLDFIFQFGFNYRSEYHPASTRAPARSSSLSIFPFGMFEFERGLTHRRYRLFWFISWKTAA